MGNANLQDTNIRTHERAVELGRMGGMAKHGDIKHWAHRQYCDAKCSFYSRCPAITTSMGIKLEEYEWNHKQQKWIKLLEPRIVPKKDRKCYPCWLKTQPKEIQNDFFHIFEKGEEGMIAVIMDLYFRYASKTRGKISMKEMRESIETSLAVKKSLYGDTQKIEHSGGIGIVILDDIPKKIIETVAESKEPIDEP